jgi:hypothetical protein
MSSENRNFLRFSTAFPARLASRSFPEHPIRNSATMANNLTPTNRRGALSSWCFLSTAVAWVWIPVCPDSRLALISGCDRDQTLGLRSVVPLAGSSLSGATLQAVNQPAHQAVNQPTHAEVRSSTSATQTTIPCIAVPCKFGVPLLPPHPQATGSEYQPKAHAAIGNLWRSCEEAAPSCAQSPPLATFSATTVPSPPTPHTRNFRQSCAFSEK